MGAWVESIVPRKGTEPAEIKLGSTKAASWRCPVTRHPLKESPPRKEKQETYSLSKPKVDQGDLWVQVYLGVGRGHLMSQ